MSFNWSRFSILGVFLTFIFLTVLLSPLANDSAANAIEPGDLAQDEHLYLPMIMTPFSPLSLGLFAQWDGVGYLRLDIYDTVGTHLTREFDQKTGPDTGRIATVHWYNPDPFGWGSSSWYEYYSLSNGRYLSSSTPGDPSWKWGFAWLVPLDFDFYNGQEMYIGGQKFSVTGPHSGLTAFGKPVSYWQVINMEKFLFYDDGGNWKQYVHAGDAKLNYDAGRTRLLIKSDIKRTYYLNGTKTQYTVN